MANGMWDLKGWRLLSPEEAAELARRDRQEWDRLLAEQLERWPMSQRRPRCYNCGAFMPVVHYDHTKCKACGESFMSLQ